MDGRGKITPFSAWKISLPATETNRNIRFTGLTVNIVLRFSVVALLVDVVTRSIAPAHRPRALAAAASSENAVMAVAAGAAAGTAPTKDNLLDQMFQNQAVLKGWDVVLNLMEDPVNKLLAAQHQEKFQDNPMKIDVQFCQGPIDTGNGLIGVFTKFSATLDAPVLHFEQNNHDYVTITQGITAGSITTGSKPVDENYDPLKDCKTDDPAVKWVTPKNVDVTQKPCLSGSVPLSRVSGIVQTKKGQTPITHSVVLDFAQGAYTALYTDVHTNLAELNRQIQNYFATHEIQYIVNTVDFSDITTLKSLQPTGFKLNVLTTNSQKNILQLFITTDGTQQNNLTINVNEPIPDGFDNSLMINTKIMFNSIFVQSFNKGGTNIQVASVPASSDFTAWSARVTNGSVSGTVDFGSDSDNYRIGAAGNTVTWSIQDLVFTRDKSQGIALQYSTKKTVGFQYRSLQCVEGMCQYTNWEDHSVDVNVALTGDYPIKIGGQEELQTIMISDVPPTVNVDNTDLQPRGACECNDNDLKIRVRNLLKEKIPDAVKTQMSGITFQSISLFALFNLLFPAKGFIKMDEAYVPGDLVVLGHFLKFSD